MKLSHIVIMTVVVLALLFTGCDSTGAGGGGGGGDDAGAATEPTVVRVTNLDTVAGERDLMILVAPDNYDLLDEFGVKGVEAVNDLHGMCFQTCNQGDGEVSIELRTLSGEPFAGANGQSYTLFFSYEEGDVPTLIGTGTTVDDFDPFSHTFTGTGSPQMVNVALPDSPYYANLFEYIDTVQVEVTNITLPAWNDISAQPDDEIWDLFVVVTESSVDVPGPDSFIAIAEKHEIGEYGAVPDVGPLLLADEDDIPWLPESGVSYNIFVVIETRVWDLGGDQHSFYKSIAMDTVPESYVLTDEETWPVVNPDDLGAEFGLFVVAGTPDSGKGDDALYTINLSGVEFTWFAHGVSED